MLLLAKKIINSEQDLLRVSFLLEKMISPGARQCLSIWNNARISEVVLSDLKCKVDDYRAGYYFLLENMPCPICHKSLEVHKFKKVLPVYFSPEFLRKKECKEVKEALLIIQAKTNYFDLIYYFD